MLKIIAKIIGTKHDREMKTIQPVIDQINKLEDRFKAYSEAELKGMTSLFKERVAKGESLDSLLPEAFAMCRESSRRCLGMRHYDVQLIGGYVLHRGGISEMRTGEGKTLVATLPVYLNALSGKGVHVVTVNDYLAKRDAEWMGRLYSYMGMSTGIIVHDLSDAQRQAAYGSDITYATNNELGFDYLRDNMKFRLSDYVQRDLNFAIVDECDSILIDEARTPLIISGSAEDNTRIYQEIHGFVKHLKPDEHFTIEEKNRSVAISEEGNTKLEQLMGIENLYDPQHIDKLHHVYQALKAIHLFKRDVDYMVKDDEIVIVDEFTGRLMEGRRWSDGLHQAVEAKEGVHIKNESQTLASITFQNYFRMYKKISGMTGTADTEAEEFRKIYKLNVSTIPTNKPMIRKDVEDVVYKSEKGKFSAIINDVVERKQKGQPVLVGTVSIEKSELLSSELKKKNVAHTVLNAKYHEREAEIIAQAGRAGAVTIATNMAGRGTDIILGGNAEFMARAAGVEAGSEAYQQAVEKFKVQCEAEKKSVLSAGGLYIVGTERHESRRIDNQLRGRSGRQGDPGETRFYLSLEDDLMRKFNGDRIKRIMDSPLFNIPDDEPMTARMVTRSIEGAQRKVEGHNFDIRKHLLEFDDVMNLQRTKVYAVRRALLEEDSTGATTFEEKIKEMMGEVTSDLLDLYADENVKRQEWDLPALAIAFEKQFGIEISFEDKITSEDLLNKVKSTIQQKYEEQKRIMGELFDDIQRSLLLGAIDHYWKEHLYRVDRIRESVNLKAYAQKDPLMEYRKETFQAFEEMNQRVRADVVEKFMKLKVVMEQQRSDESVDTEEARDEILEALRPKQPQKMTLSSGTPSDEEDRANRNQRRQVEKTAKKKKKLF
jgi:preprotein translocase subunit SecA